MIFERFPSTGIRDLEADQTNPAIRLYGRRFYKDQTPVEYLAEFLLVFASPKSESGAGRYSLLLDSSDGRPRYWPEDRIALKLFTFFPSSKLETRHPIHQKAYLQALDNVKARVIGSEHNKDEVIRLLQSLFAGFVGVAKNRTWVTQSFLPASGVLLSRELDWLHSQAVRDNTLSSWDDAKRYFAKDRHNFMARGGELLFLQLANLFSNPKALSPISVLESKEYDHLHIGKLFELRERVELSLRSILDEATRPIQGLADLTEQALSSFKLDARPQQAPLGWVPAVSRSEALLFAFEMDNICSSTLGLLEKLELLQILCCMQVLRSLCFQAQRFDAIGKSTAGFIGDYVWIAADPHISSGTSLGKLAQSSFNRIEELLYRVLRKSANLGGGVPQNLNEADKHGFQIFRKIGKELGLIIPRTGRGGQRFVLPPPLLRFLVAALLRPEERVRLTNFYERVFAHYGIALGDRQLATALRCLGNESGSKNYAVAADSAWVEEALRQGGFLVELSDAVSIVHNPGEGRGVA